MTAAAVCTIRVAGHLDDHWSHRLGGLRITHQDDGTSTLHGPVADQAQLHGVLAGLRDIGATLLELHCADPGSTDPGNTDPGSTVVARPGEGRSSGSTPSGRVWPGSGRD